MKKYILLFTLGLFCVTNYAQRIETSYWDCTLGDTYEQVYNTLKDANLNPIATEDGVFLKDNDIFKVQFSTIGMKFTVEDAFYNIFGYNKYTSKKEAMEAFDIAIEKVKLSYPNVQPMSKPEGCLRLYAYTDDGHENVFSLGLYKGNNGVFFLRINIYSDYLLKRASTK